VQVAIVVAGVDDLRQAGSDIEGVVGGGAVYGLADAVAEAVVDGLQGCWAEVGLDESISCVPSVCLDTKGS
jgi:hypothetical protein